MAENVDERVVGRDCGVGVNGEECVAGWWGWRRRRSACGAGGREDGCSHGGGGAQLAALAVAPEAASVFAATATTTAVMEVAEKEVAVKTSSLESIMPNARHEGGWHMV